MLPTDHSDDDDVPEAIPETQTQSSGGAGRNGLTRIGSGDIGDSGGGSRYRKFGNFDPSEVPSGQEFVERITTLFPNLTPSTRRSIEFMSRLDSPTLQESMEYLKKLKRDSSAGDSVYHLLICNGRLVAWIVKDFALELASSFQDSSSPDLDSLVFTELLERANTYWHARVWSIASSLMQEDESAEFEAIPAEVVDQLSNTLTHFHRIASANRLYGILKYRSVENELMQSHERRLTDEELADAMSVTPHDVLTFKKWNKRYARWLAIPRPLFTY